MIDFFAPAAADVNLKSVLTVFDGVETALTHTATAVVTDFFVNLQNAVLHLCRADGTGCLYAALLTSVAAILVKFGDSLTDDSQII